MTTDLREQIAAAMNRAVPEIIVGPNSAAVDAVLALVEPMVPTPEDYLRAMGQVTDATARAERAEAAVERVRALADESEVERVRHGRREGIVDLSRLRRALAGDAAPNQDGDDRG